MKMKLLILLCLAIIISGCVGTGDFLASAAGGKTKSEIEITRAEARLAEQTAELQRVNVLLARQQIELQQIEINRQRAKLQQIKINRQRAKDVVDQILDEAEQIENGGDKLNKG